MSLPAARYTVKSLGHHLEVESIFREAKIQTQTDSRTRKLLRANRRYKLRLQREQLREELKLPTTSRLLDYGVNCS
jgi:hypothetical protein